MAKKKSAPKKSVTKKVTKKITPQKESAFSQELLSKDVFLIIVLVAFIVIAATLIKLYY